jgi:hypothetical protein
MGGSRRGASSRPASRSPPPARHSAPPAPAKAPVAHAPAAHPPAHAPATAHPPAHAPPPAQAPVSSGGPGLMGTMVASAAGNKHILLSNTLHTHIVTHTSQQVVWQEV